MSQMISLLNEMRGRLAVYVGSNSLTKLAAFLRGYDYALEKNAPGENTCLLAEFRDWIHQRYGTAAHSWEDLSPWQP